MASIIKRKKNYSVVYNYVDENGETKQKWETWHYPQGGLEAQGGNRKSAAHGNFSTAKQSERLPSSFMTSLSLYGEKKWGRVHV